MTDPDRRVRTEAIRALGFHDDDASFAMVMAGLDSADSWTSVSAAEAMGRFASRKDVVTPKLVAATAATKPLALRITAMQSLVAMAPEAAIEAAAALAVEASATARNAARQALNRLGDPGKARLAALTAAPGAPPPTAPAAPQAETPAKTLADYAAIVQKWVVPDFNGAPKPRAILDTPRGQIEVELYAGDAPLGLVEFVRLVESGALVGTEFSRVVPNFVDQQATTPGAARLRDEVNRRGLTRGNLAWASSGLDTGRMGLTLGHTPQPHNEGNFTSLGRVVAGLDAMDRIELGDKITGARLKK
jgi:cyclophilin family peptidyl-prolyl cis-trans isomerase